jgi:Na+/H+ antiporter NhaD/arsenite permease-like protein
VYRFAKQIASDEPLIVEASYIKDTPFMIIKIVLFLLLVYALYRRRTWLKKFWDSQSAWYKRQLARHMTPLGTLVISALLFSISFFSLPLIFTKGLFVLLVGAVFYYIVSFLKTRKERKREEKGTEIQG